VENFHWSYYISHFGTLFSKFSAFKKNFSLISIVFSWKINFQQNFKEISINISKKFQQNFREISVQIQRFFNILADKFTFSNFVKNVPKHKIISVKFFHWKYKYFIYYKYYNINIFIYLYKYIYNIFIIYNILKFFI